jgi:hypothetical protein
MKQHIDLDLYWAEQRKKGRLTRFVYSVTFGCAGVIIPVAMGAAATGRWLESLPVLIIFLPVIVGFSFFMLWVEKKADG